MFDLSLTVDSSNSFPTKQRGRARNRNLHQETSTPLFAPVKSDFDKLRVRFPTFPLKYKFLEEISLPAPVFSFQVLLPYLPILSEN